MKIINEIAEAVAIWLVLILALVTLAGCSGWGSVKQGIAYHGANIADEELEAAEWAHCEAPTAGALRRKYANDPEGLKAWQECCRRRNTAPVSP